MLYFLDKAAIYIIPIGATLGAIILLFIILSIVLIALLMRRSSKQTYTSESIVLEANNTQVNMNGGQDIMLHRTSHLENNYSRKGAVDKSDRLSGVSDQYAKAV